MSWGLRLGRARLAAVAAGLILSAGGQGCRAAQVPGSDPTLVEWMQHFTKASVARQKKKLAEEKREYIQAIENARELERKYDDQSFLRLSLRELAIAYRWDKEFRLAERSYRQLIELEAKSIDRSSDLTALGRLYMQWKRYAEAEAVLEQSLAVKDGHGRICGSLTKQLLVRCYVRQRKLDEAEALAKDLVDDRDLLVQVSPAARAYYLMDLASVYLLKKELDMAGGTLTEIASIYENAESNQLNFSPGEWKHFMTTYASFLETKGDREKAKKIRSQLAARIKEWKKIEPQWFPAPDVRIAKPAKDGGRTRD